MKLETIKTYTFLFLALGSFFLGLTGPGARAQDSTLEIRYLPEGCGNPFVENASFSDFFDSSVSAMAVERGASSPGIVELFSVLELRNALSEEQTDPSMESPIDRLLVSQLCQFQRIENASSVGMGNEARKRVQQIPSNDPKLHNHLKSIASKLYKDARELYLVDVTEKARKRAKDQSTAKRLGEIRKAKIQARQKVQNLMVESL